MRRNILLGFGFAFLIAVIGVVAYGRYTPRNVANAAPSAGRLIQLGDRTISSGDTFTFGLVNVSDCSTATFMVMSQSPSTADFGHIGYNISPDGSTVIIGPHELGGSGNLKTMSSPNNPLSVPFLQLIERRNSAVATPETATGWIWCQF